MRGTLLAAIAAGLKPPSSGLITTPAALNPADMRSGIVLSNSNRTATVPSDLPNGIYGVRADSPKVTGKKFFEVHIDVLPPGSPEISIGLASQFQDLTWYSSGGVFQSFAARDSDGMVVQHDSNVHQGVGVDPSRGFVQGDTCGLAVDYDLLKWWYTKDGVIWNGEGIATQNPATGVGGVSFDGQGLAWRYPWIYGTPGTQWTVNFGDSAFLHCPAGFTGYEKNVGNELWRVNVTSSAGGAQTSVVEMEFALSPGGPDITTPTTRLWADPSLEGFGWFRQMAIDNNFVTNGTGSGPNGWNTYPGNFGYFAIALPPSDIKEVRIWCRSDVNFNEGPGTFTIDKSADGYNWTTVKTVTGETGWVGGVGKSYSIP